MSNITYPVNTIDNDDVLLCIPDFIDDKLEKDLLNKFYGEYKDKWEYICFNSRRVMQFGQKYNYFNRNIGVKNNDDLELPEFLINLVKKINNCIKENKILQNYNYFNFCQAIVNEYLPGQGISKHIDNKSYGDLICSISIGEDTNFALSNGSDVITTYLPRKSLLLFSGKYRYKWSHAINKRKTVDKPEKNKIKRVKKNNNRISITFRTI